ncbi:MAG TPA: bifunctional serine/threonine-protein kinase/formylglycine-generating enzyme family protein [Opitutaceae bacterium]|nr:bifunctional serine/threonine-protein kinase/formylglycine-generating enzyme family protein [Opitutaceae bacterium]
MDDLDLGATVKGFSPGQKLFNRYVLRKILGRGGMGVVWLAQDQELERDIALKFLPEIVALDPEAVTDLKRETRRNLELTHPNIVRIYDFVTDSRTAAISMEFVDGATLTALKLERPGRVFTIAELRPWLGQLVDALHYAHTRPKIVHRDLKPGNLMVTRSGELKVTDFGIARGISDSVSRVSAHAGSSGTPVYMSPQQMMGEKPSVADDVYAFGATLYELLTGKPPFYSGNVILQVQSKVAPSLADRRAEFGVEGEAIPAEWERTIAACLAKEASDRPAGIRAAAARLGLIEGMPVEIAAPRPADPAPEPPPLPVAAARPRSSAVPAVVVAALCFLLLAGGAVAWWFGVHLPERRRQAEQARIAAEAEAERLRQEQLLVQAGQREQVVANLRKLMAAADQYFLENGKAEAPVEELIGPDKYLPELRPVRGESYLAVGTIRQGEEFRVKTVDGWTFVANSADGTVETASPSEPAGPEPAQAPNYPAAGTPWGNSLGQRFAPVPGLSILLSVHETRVSEFNAFVADTGMAWNRPEFPHTGDHPAVNVTWHQAKAFCAWLTDRERALGWIRPEQRYRLPTDVEWSVAVGLGEEPGETPEAKDAQIGDVYPWGKEAWPPPAGAGNFADQALLRADETASVIEGGYDDGFAYTAPVGSFAAVNGFHDLAGNVWEWCEDVYTPSDDARALRGGSWAHAGHYLNFTLLSSYRNALDRATESSDVGFRMVLEPAPPSN